MTLTWRSSVLTESNTSATNSDNGESIPKPPARDSITMSREFGWPHRFRRVHRASSGQSIVEDIHGNSNNASQDFALVISGLLASPGIGVISMTGLLTTVRLGSRWPWWTRIGGRIRNQYQHSEQRTESLGGNTAAHRQWFEAAALPGSMRDGCGLSGL